MKKVLFGVICLISLLIFAQDVKKMTFSSSIMGGLGRSRNALGTSSSSSVDTETTDTNSLQKKKRITILKFSKTETALSQAHKTKLAEIVKRYLARQTSISTIKCYGEDLEIVRTRCNNLIRYFGDNDTVSVIPNYIFSDDPKDKETVKIFEN